MKNKFQSDISQNQDLSIHVSTCESTLDVKVLKINFTPDVKMFKFVSLQM